MAKEEEVRALFAGVVDEAILKLLFSIIEYEREDAVEQYKDADWHTCCCCGECG